jgi:hypothetical protein
VLPKAGSSSCTAPSPVTLRWLDAPYRQAAGCNDYTRQVHSGMCPVGTAAAAAACDQRVQHTVGADLMLATGPASGPRPRRYIAPHQGCSCTPAVQRQHGHPGHATLAMHTAGTGGLSDTQPGWRKLLAAGWQQGAALRQLPDMPCCCSGVWCTRAACHCLPASRLLLLLQAWCTRRNPTRRTMFLLSK